MNGFITIGLIPVKHCVLLLSIPLNGFTVDPGDPHAVPRYPLPFNSIEWIHVSRACELVKYDVKIRLSIPLNGFSTIANTGMS